MAEAKKRTKKRLRAPDWGSGNFRAYAEAVVAGAKSVGEIAAALDLEVPVVRRRIRCMPSEEQDYLGKLGLT
jgi:hypothetical protein